MSQNKMLTNAKWIIACKVAQSLLQMVIGMLSARYLGPVGYGLIHYAKSVTAFVVPVMQLGLQATLVREYVTRPEKNGEILGTSMLMTVCSGFLCMLGVISFAMVANWGEPTTIWVCALYSTSLLFQAVELTQYWFQARLLSKYSSMAMLTSYVVVSCYKIFLLISGKSVYWFALSMAVEYGMTSLILLVAYSKVGDQPLRFSWKTARELFSRSKYYIIAALMVTVYQSTDHIMLTLISGEAQNGYYTTAITCTIVVSFVYYAIIDSARPVILGLKKNAQKDFEKSVSSLYSVVFYLTLAQSICFAVLAKPIVLILFGQSYIPAIPVLRIIIWQIAFSFMGTVRDVWILAEEKHSILWKVNICGIPMNICLNALMIPRWGACGAAFASVVTQIFTNFVVGFLLKPLRPNNRLLVQGLNPKYIAEMVSVLRQKSA